MEEAQRRIKKCIQYGETSLNIFGLELKELPNNLPNNLTRLDCSFNKITKLENLPNNLTILICSYNKIAKLENLPNNLIELNCYYNKYLYISKKYAQKFRLGETPNYEKNIIRIQKFWKNKKILNFMKSQTSHQFFDILDLHKLVTIYL
jgi:Leucine-rich repeat (LRR) protein